MLKIEIMLEPEHMEALCELVAVRNLAFVDMDKCDKWTPESMASVILVMGIRERIRAIEDVRAALLLRTNSQEPITKIL